MRRIETWENGELLSVREAPEPEPTAEDLAKESALEKLEKLGLTKEEALAIAGNE
jgi:hypothetical protein